MNKKSSGNVPASVASGLICLTLGGAIGFFARDSQIQGASAAGVASTRGGGGGGGATGGLPPPPGFVAPGGSGGGGQKGGGQGGAAPNPGRDLARLVSGLNTVEKVQNKGLTAEQKKQLLPLLEAIQKADTLPEAEATAKLDAVKKALTADQQQMLTDLTPQRGGRGGGAGGGRGGAGGPVAVAVGGGGGAAPDPAKPFASERNKKALDDLIAHLK